MKEYTTTYAPEEFADTRHVRQLTPVQLKKIAKAHWRRVESGKVRRPLTLQLARLLQAAAEV